MVMAQPTNHSSPARPLFLTLRISREERDRLHEVAAGRGLSASDLVRQELQRVGAFPVE